MREGARDRINFALHMGAEDAVPTMDQSAPLATYADWSREKTKIITYAVGSSYPGIPATSLQEARAQCERDHGRIYEENFVPGRAFFRVAK